MNCEFDFFCSWDIKNVWMRIRKVLETAVLVQTHPVAVLGRPSSP